MIKNNYFFIPKLKNVVIIGYHIKLIEINKFLKNKKINHIIITSKDQSKSIKGIKFNIFNKIDDKFKNFILKKYKIDETLFISLGSRIIFKEEVINNFFKKNLVNFHNSRLPLDAGGGGMSWRILRRDRIDNQLVHLVDKGIDTGPIITTNKNIFPAALTIPAEMENFSFSKFEIFFKDFISNLKKGKKYELKSQIDYSGRYNPRLNTKINGWIDWNMSSENLIRFINAFDDPYTGAQTSINGINVRIKKAQLHDGESFNHPFMTGLISRNDKKWIVVSTTDSAMILIENVLNSNNKNIISSLKAGDRFTTSKSKLFQAKEKRVTYNAKGLIKNKSR
jgi:methionyl-tRNA formyltransferase